jgi:hypothetical protein
MNRKEYEREFPWHIVKFVFVLFVYLFCSLFNDAFSVSHTIVSYERMISKYELERMWMKAVAA